MQNPAHWTVTGDHLHCCQAALKVLRPIKPAPDQREVIAAAARLAAAAAEVCARQMDLRSTQGLTVTYHEPGGEWTGGKYSKHSERFAFNV